MTKNPALMAGFFRFNKALAVTVGLRINSVITTSGLSELLGGGSVTSLCCLRLFACQKG